MSEETITPDMKKEKKEKNIKLIQLFFQVLAYFAAMMFVGIIITLIAYYGISAITNPLFNAEQKTIIGVISIPLFSVILLSGIIVAIIDLRKSVIAEEGEVQEFKLT